MIVLDLSILNQKGTPMFNSDTFANRPAFGIVGRIFISIDTAAIYRDTGTAWDLIADGGSASTNIYNSNGTLSANRTVASGGFNLTFNPSTTFDTTLTAANNASSLALFGVNRVSYAAAFSANNIGALYGGASAFALQTFAGSATFANSNVASGGSSVNSIDFSSGGSTITMTQSSGIRVMSGQQNLFQYQGTNSGTITHAAISQNTGFYRPSAATGILTITNAYSHLINALDDYGAGFTFTNRWGIYQAGASDVNYFAANTLIGTSINGGFKLSVLGNSNFNGIISIGANSLGSSANYIGQTMAINDNWKIFGTGSTSDLGEMVFQVGDNGSSFASGNGQRFRFSYDVTGGTGTAKDTFIIDYDTITTPNNLIINSLVNSGQNLQVNGTATITANVTIGTTTSTVRLHVADDGNTFCSHFSGNAQTNGIAFGTDSGNNALIQGYTKTFSAVTNISLQSSGGNVLIGTATNGASKLRIVGLPTSAVGLSSGDVYSNAGILTIVP